MLKSDSSTGGPIWSYKSICEAYEVSSLTIYNVCKNFTKGGLKRVYKRRLDGESEAKLIVLACS